MIEYFNQHQPYIVLTLVLLIWFGLAGYLFRLGRRISALEQRLKKD
jgi:CcmD family protein